MGHRPSGSPSSSCPPRSITPCGAAASDAGRWRLLILLLAYTGLRWGEATALWVCDIDLDRRRIDVRRAFSDVGGRVVLGTPKSHQSRSVPVPRFVVAELRALPRARRTGRQDYPAARGPAATAQIHTK